MGGILCRLLNLSVGTRPDQHSDPRQVLAGRRVDRSGAATLCFALSQTCVGLVSHPSRAR
jgi:hypothetical protein